MSELFAKCYVDENISFVFVKVLRAKGIDVITPVEAGSVGFNDAAQLQLAIDLERVFITLDRKTFLKHSNASEHMHYGIVLISEQLNPLNAASAAEKLYDKYLNKYTKDEWMEQVFYL